MWRIFVVNRLKDVLHDAQAQLRICVNVIALVTLVLLLVLIISLEGIQSIYPGQTIINHIGCS